MNTRLYSFVGGKSGPWRIERQTTVVGDPIPLASRLTIVAAGTPNPGEAEWTLRGVTSNERYVERREKDDLVARQPSLGRPESTHAALIPLRKNAAWWALTQDARRRIFEDGSRHIQTGMSYLPAVARRLHHCRDLAEAEPFDFLTWFEFAPVDANAFDDLLGRLRATEEWSYIDREVEVRVTRDDA